MAAVALLEIDAPDPRLDGGAVVLDWWVDLCCPGDYVELAEHLGLDSDEVALALFDGRHAAAVKADHDEGRSLGVTGTPSFVVNGLLVDAGDTLVGAKDAVLTRVRRALG